MQGQELEDIVEKFRKGCAKYQEAREDRSAWKTVAIHTGLPSCQTCLLCALSRETYYTVVRGSLLTFVCMKCILAHLIPEGFEECTCPEHDKRRYTGTYYIKYVGGTVSRVKKALQ